MIVFPRLRDRWDAGVRLGTVLHQYVGRSDVIVLGLPRGGVPVAAAVAQALRAPLDVLTVCKLGVPGQPELAMGAIATGGARVMDEDIVAAAAITTAEVEAAVRRETLELARREAALHLGHPPTDISGRTAILVDDGMATGATMRAAVRAVRQRRAAYVVVAVPVASAEACAALTAEADRCVCLHTPTPFFSVGDWYVDFTQVDDAEVRDLLARSSSAVLGVADAELRSD